MIIVLGVHLQYSETPNRLLRIGHPTPCPHGRVSDVAKYQLHAVLLLSWNTDLTPKMFGFGAIGFVDRQSTNGTTELGPLLR